jgi:cyclophilin family peptidyl-prolyl cis-trans isomerase
MKTVIEPMLAIVVLGFVFFWHATRSHEIRVQCKTTKGDLAIIVMPEWSPRGAQRFLEMVDDGYFNNLPLFRCIENFVCQFGPAFQKSNAKEYSTILDDPRIPDLRNFKKGYMSFAGRGPNTRSTHIFIALGEPESLGSQSWETPFGYITEATFDSSVRHFTTQYGEMAPTGHGPDGEKIRSFGGEDYLKTNFPELDYFQSCSRK